MKNIEDYEDYRRDKKPSEDKRLKLVSSHTENIIEHFKILTILKA